MNILSLDLKYIDLKTKIRIILSVIKSALSVWKKLIKYILINRLIYSDDINIRHSPILFLMFIKELSIKINKNMRLQQALECQYNKMFYSQENVSIFHS